MRKPVLVVYVGPAIAICGLDIDVSTVQSTKETTYTTIKRFDERDIPPSSHREWLTHGTPLKY